MSLEVYAFARGVTQRYLDYVRDLQGQADSSVRYTTSLLGPWESLTIVELEADDDFETALSTVMAINQAGASNGDSGVRPVETTTAVSFRPGIFVIRRRARRSFEAFVLISASAPMLDVFGILPNLEGYEGSALVTGDFDMLLLLGADSLENLRSSLSMMSDELQGLARTSTCYRVTAVGEPDVTE
jgi:hypothetical protein